MWPGPLLGFLSIVFMDLLDIWSPHYHNNWYCLSSIVSQLSFVDVKNINRLGRWTSFCDIVTGTGIMFLAIVVCIKCNCYYNTDFERIRIFVLFNCLYTNRFSLWAFVSGSFPVCFFCRHIKCTCILELSIINEIRAWPHWKLLLAFFS